MAAGATYNSIATTTLGTATNSYTFSSIPSTYTDLVLIVYTKTVATDNLAIQVNGDTATNYSNTYMAGNGTTAISGRNTSVSQAFITGTGTTFGTSIINFQNYANTTTNKTFIGRGSWSDYQARASAALWRSTSAISSITVLSTGDNFQTGSTFTLYGIASA
tara:strand:+ start:663 stop:1148 length:486 start_codon:yes stop_codon:yes gene_type:complete